MAHTLRCTVELYRSGEILRVPYDLSDRLERSIWTVLELYVDHVERRAILAAEEFDHPEVWAALHPYVDHPDSDAYLAPLGSRRAWELEEYLKDLKEALYGTGLRDVSETYDLARNVLEIIFMSEEAGVYTIPRGFWEAGGEEAPEGAASGTFERAETPLQLSHMLMPVSGMLRAALGEHISLAEAGRRLSLSPQAVEARIDEGLLHAIRVDGDLLIRAADLMDN
jgi:hypothetical protein